MTTTESAPDAAFTYGGDTRNFLLILFPAYYAERIEAVLDDVGVPGYSHSPDIVGRGPRGRHFNNPIWPGATGEIFTVVDDACAQELMQRFSALNASLREESRRLFGLHLLTLPCRSLI